MDVPKEDLPNLPCISQPDASQGSGDVCYPLTVAEGPVSTSVLVEET